MKLLDLQNWGIQRRVMVLAMMPLVTISILLGTYMISERVQTAYVNLDERGKLLATHLAPSAEFPLFSGNIELLRNLANNVANEPDVKMVRILDAQREEVIRVANGVEESDPKARKKNDVLTFEHPIGQSTFSIVDFETEITPFGSKKKTAEKTK